MVKLNRLLAPIAADAKDITSHPPLIEAEKNRQEAIEFRNSLLGRGLAWAEVLQQVEDFAVAQGTPTQDFYALKFGGAMQDELDATRAERRLQ
jgi:hypothetical protein